MQVKISQAIDLITNYIRMKLVPMLVGSPGVGKSDIIRQIAKEYKLKVIDLRLSQCDPTDLLGFPNIDSVRNRAGYVPMDTFPIEGDPIPDGYEGWLLFLDEMNSAAPAVQAAAYKLVLDRMVGQYNLHSNCAIVCAGNKETDNAIVQPMSTALQSRMAHIELEVDAEEFINWAIQHNIDSRITSYIRFRPANVYTFSADHTDKTYACPRTWEFANRVLNVLDVDSPLILPQLAGILSEGVAREFIGFMRIFNDLPKMTDIIANPTKIKVPEEPSILYALTGSLAQHTNKDNLNGVMPFVSRLPVEFQVVCLREMLRRNKTLIGHTAIQKWIESSAVTLF